MDFQIAGLCFTSAGGLAFRHDPRLVALSYLVAAAGSYAALEMIERWRSSRGRSALCWQFLSSITLGGSIWSMHFIAMLALQIELPVSYAPGSTLLSLSIAIGIVGVGLQILRAETSWFRLCCAGIAIGLGVAAMHYVGMAGMHFRGRIAYTVGLWGLSLLVGIAAATVAMWLSVALRAMWQRAGAALVMGVAICGLHFTGMASTVFRIDPNARIVPGAPSGLIAIVVALTALALIACALVFVGADRRLKASELREAASLRRANEQLLRANAELALGQKMADEANRVKSGFLAMISHEIRTPMNGVIGLAENLLNGSLSPDDRGKVQAIHESGQALLRLLNDILDLTRLEAGRMAFENAAFSPEAMTRSAIAMLSQQAEAKGLALELRCKPGLAALLIGDAGRIRQVLLNLIANAIKFTEIGTVAIGIEHVATDMHGATLRWVISDTGIGIAAENIERLFAGFMQADNSIARRFGGSGLGLAICKNFIEQMGGTIAIESDPGRGTTLRVELTLPVAEQPAALATKPGDSRTRFRSLLSARRDRLRVLVAEDNAINQLVVRYSLKPFDVEADFVGNGREAVAAVLQSRYDVILMDMQMPEMDGLEATRLIRQRGGKSANVPIVALTANGSADDRKACLSAGMNRFLPKPASLQVLLAALCEELAAGSVSVDSEAAPDKRGSAAKTPQAYGVGTTRSTGTEVPVGATQAAAQTTSTRPTPQSCAADLQRLSLNAHGMGMGWPR